MAKKALIDVTRIDGVAVVRFYDLSEAVSGIGMGQIEGLERELIAVADENPEALILDFENRDFIPAATIEGIFVKLHRRLGRNLRMCNLPAMVTGHFEMNRLDTLFRIHLTLQDTLAAVKSTS